MPDFERDLQAIKEEVRARSDIVEVIGQYTTLKRAGKTWKGLCPFHADKKPSFSVSPAMQYYTCWSCGEKGDVFTFVEKKENLDFIEALEFLARRAGIPFERKAMNREQLGEREQMVAINALAVRYYRERLGHSPEAQAYLAKRGILKQTQDQWDLGFAPNEWEGLSYYLQRQRADVGIAAKLGLIRVREGSGGTYDTFRNRLMFPIHDIQGRVIAFGGRAMGDDPAKYLNSEQSPLFDKSRTLYGLVFARKAITPTTPAVFVEGYVDVITTHQAGFSQCVATLGTSLTEEHARLLARYSPRVIICYDADTAGIKATRRGADVWESIGIEGAEVRVARLPAGEDPDSLIYGGRSTVFQKALDKAVPRIDFEIDLALKRHDIESEDGRSQALAEIIPILANVNSLTQRDKYVERVAHLHPARRFDFKRALEALHADIAAHRQSGDGRSGRDRGFPLTEKTNRAPLANEPAPPSYRAPTSEGWGRWDPGTGNVRRAGESGRPGFKEERGGRGGDEGRSGWGGNDNRGERAGEGRGGWGGNEGRGADNRGGRGGRRSAPDPMRDSSPPSLALPPLSGAEKAERQLLRALFTPDWRSFVLGRVPPDLFITPQAREMFTLAARMPAREDGSIDAARVFREAEALDAARLPEPPKIAPTEIADDGEYVADPSDTQPGSFNSSQSGTSDAFVSEGHAAAGHIAKEFIPSHTVDRTEPDFIPSHTVDRTEPDFIPSRTSSRTVARPEPYNPDPKAPPEESQTAPPNPASEAGSNEPIGDRLPPPVNRHAGINRQGGRMPAKTSDFIREVLEDSLSVMSNEPLSDLVLADCIRRLQMHREEQATREISERLSRNDLTPEERKIANQLLHEKKRQSRGSPPAVADDNG